MLRSLYSKPVWVLAFGLAFALATAGAHAQGPPRGPGGRPGGPGGFGGPGGPGGPSLVMSPEVQKELGLSAKQEAQVKRLTGSIAQKRREVFAGEQGEGSDPRARMSAMMELQRQAEASITKSLNKRQKDRLAQLELQREGNLAVARKEVASKLKLTSAQSKEVKSAVDEMRQAMARSMPRPPGGGPPPGAEGERQGRRRAPGDGPGPGGRNPEGDTPPQANGTVPPAGEGSPDAPAAPRRGRPNFDSEEFRAQMTKMRETQMKLRETANAKIDEILTAEQKAAFEKLRGQPFDFSKIGPPGGGPPGGRPRNQGRRNQQNP